eukprot:scaffold39547_cov57-Phaeocystis_antarctica.AAC.1
MCRMFKVRSTPVLIQPAFRPLPICPPFHSAQSASEFNQPLTLDTTSVTTMVGMFTVRPTRTHDLRPQSSQSNLHSHPSHLPALIAQ